MAQQILLKRSAIPGKVPTTDAIALGEVAINTYDGRFYFKKDNGTQSIVETVSTTVGGIIPTNKLGSGTADTSTYLRGDGSWQSTTSGSIISDDTTTNANYYLALTVATYGAMIDTKVSSTKLTFNPSTGLLTSTAFSGSGSSLTNLNASNLSSGTVSTERLGTGTADTSTYLRGDGSWQTITSGESITNINATNISTGTVSTERLGTGTADSTTYLRGDGSWQTISNLSASVITSGTVNTDRLGTGTADSTTYLRGDGSWQAVPAGTIVSDDTTTNSTYYPSLSSVTSGTFSTATVSSTKLTFNPSTGLLTSTEFSGSGSSLTNLNASNLSSGTVNTARLGTGTADSTTYLRGDGSWQTISTSSTWVIKTSAYTAVSGDMILADSTAAAFTITLPASPVAGNQIIVADAGGTFNTKNVTIGRNGANILGLAQDLILNIANEKVTIVYYNSTRGWILA